MLHRKFTQYIKVTDKGYSIYQPWNSPLFALCPDPFFHLICWITHYFENETFPLETKMDQQFPGIPGIKRIPSIIRVDLIFSEKDFMNPTFKYYEVK